MLKKILKLLTNNLGLKIASVLVAVIVWLVVMNLDNPDKTTSFTIPVTVTGEDQLADMGKVYEVYNNTDVATIYVTGKRALMDTLSATDFRATADLSNIDFQSQSDIKLVPITIIPPARYEKDLTFQQKTVNMQITIEDLSTEQFNISGDVQGTPAEGYAIGEVTVSPNLIRVSGPRSVVSRVKRVSANINVQGATSDVRDNVALVLYDENDNVIESPQLKLNQDRVAVTVQMLGTKEVPVKCLTTGEPADGYQFIELEYAPERIRIKGIPSVLNGISEIVIPGEAIDLTGATGDVENSIDITPYVEERGVMLWNAEENKIAVKAIVERLEIRSFDLPINAIELLNQNEEYDISFGTNTITVQVRGRSEELQSLTAAAITASIDLERIQLGDHMLEVQIKVPEPYYVMGTVNVQVHVTEKGTEPEGGASGGNEPGGLPGGSTPAGSGNVGSGGGTGGSSNNENHNNEGAGNE